MDELNRLGNLLADKTKFRDSTEEQVDWMRKRSRILEQLLFDDDHDERKGEQDSDQAGPKTPSTAAINDDVSELKGEPEL